MTLNIAMLSIMSLHKKQSICINLPHIFCLTERAPMSSAFSMWSGFYSGPAVYTIYINICLNMGRGEAFVLTCFLKNSSSIKEGSNGAHTMETSYKQEF
jgi:hypothetical protein